MKKTSLFLLLALALGLITGILNIAPINSFAEVISSAFLNLLQLISVPIIFLSITATITGMQDLKEMRFLGWKIFRYTLLTTLIAATTALIFFWIFNPTISPNTTVDAIATSAPASTYLASILKIFPANFTEAFLENNVLGIAFISVLLSVSILMLPEEKKNFLHTLFSTLFSALLNTTKLIIRTLPIGIWAFITLFCQEIAQNSDQLYSILIYIGCIVGANLFQGLIVLPLFAKSRGLSPLKLAKGMSSALFLAFFSKSSNATLPEAMRCAEKNLGVDRKIGGFSFPLCSVINMNACAGFILITVLFVATSSGMVFSTWEMIGWIFLATLAAIGNAGVPMGCYFLSSAFLSSMNVPLYLMGLILPIYTLLDMLETMINVWSDSCITCVIDKEIKESSIKEPLTSHRKEQLL